MREWIVGRNPIYEVLRAARRQCFRLQAAQGIQERGRLSEIISLCERKKIPIEHVSRSKIETAGPGNQGVALEVSGYPYSNLAEILERSAGQGEDPFILILDALQDPQNLGTLMRTAEIVGIHGILLPYRQTATVTPAVVHASSGASEHLLVAQVNLAQAIAMLKETGLWVVGLEGSPEAQLPEEVRLEGPLALVVGNEGQGMRHLVRKSCDMLLRLPMRGQIDSLNAAVAGSVALYFAWQSRKFSGLRTV
jgi:23S rRNA (guanosine2251-2'-O)-methyltransferase